MSFFSASAHDKKLMAWACGGLLVFVSAFLWAPSRDGIQIIYLLAFFIPISLLLICRKFNFTEYGGWPTVIALVYAGFCTLSSLWGNAEDIGFFTLQWFVLLTWLCGSCLVLSRYEIDLEKYINWFIAAGVIIILLTVCHYYYFVFGVSSTDKRLWGWNVFRNANEIGALCGVVGLLAFVNAIRARNMLRVWLFYFLTVLACIGLVASFSRGAVIAFGFASILALIIVRPPLKVWLPPVSILLILYFVILSSTNLFDGYISGNREGLDIRVYVWADILKRCMDHIFLGVGVSQDSKIIVPDIGIFNHAHNAWLDTLYRSGLVGLILITFHTVIVLKASFRNTRALPLFLWLIYGCVCNLFDGRVFFTEIGAKWFLYWVPAALIVAILTAANLKKNSPHIGSSVIN